MLSNKAALYCLLAAAGAAGQVRQAVPPVGAAHAFTCPATAKGHKFLRPSIYNGTAGKEEYELAPDDERTKGRQVTQIWKLSDYADMRAFVRCRYEGTSLAVVKDLPAELKVCTFRFRKVPGNQVVSEPWFECR